MAAFHAAPAGYTSASLIDAEQSLSVNPGKSNNSSRTLQLPKQKTSKSPGSSHISSTGHEQKKQLCKKWREIHGACNWHGLIPLQDFNKGSSNNDKDIDYRFQDRTTSARDDHHEASCASAMDEDLRSEIIKYGEFAQACYDAFDNDEHSRFRGDSKFTPDKLLRETTTGDLISHGYKVTKFLYATAHSDFPSFFTRPRDREMSWSNDSNWMGFVAVSTSADEISRLGRREIIVSWRGTVTGLEWMQNLHDFLQPTGLDPSDKNTEGIKVESGFLNLYTTSNSRSRHNKRSAREQLLDEIRRLVNKYQGEELSITVTGHSLGGALALLSAYDIAELELTSLASGSGTIPTSVFSFSAPRVGNRLFAARCEQLNVRALRVVNKRDIVPKVPGIVFNEQHQGLCRMVERLVHIPWAYAHVGSVVALDTSDSSYLRRDADLIAQHNLEGLLHLVDGYQGPGKKFRPSGKRDVALVNKDSNLLHPDCGIPPYWKTIIQQKTLVTGGADFDRVGSIHSLPSFSRQC